MGARLLTGCKKGAGVGATQEGGRRPRACSERRAKMQAAGRQNLVAVQNRGPPQVRGPLRRRQSVLKTTWPFGKGVSRELGGAGRGVGRLVQGFPGVMGQGGLRRKHLGSELVDQEILEGVDSPAKAMVVCGG